MRTPHPPLAMQLHSLVDLQMSSSINGRFINVVVHILNIAANLHNYSGHTTHAFLENEFWNKRRLVGGGDR
jgi:hypothetical protein